MLEEIKKIQGINHEDFDSIITGYINSGIADLKAIGIVEEKVNESDPLIHTAIFTYVLSFLDVNSYNLQKDYLRHLKEYQGE